MRLAADFQLAIGLQIADVGPRLALLILLFVNVVEVLRTGKIAVKREVAGNFSLANPVDQLPKQHAVIFCNLVYRAHDQAVTVCVFQMYVKPGACAGRKLRRRQFPGCKGYFCILRVEMIAINIHIFEIVIKPYFLQLFVSLDQRPGIPEPDIMDSGVILFYIIVGYGLPHRERFFFDLVQPKRQTGEFYVMEDIGCFLCQLGGLDHILFNQGGVNPGKTYENYKIGPGGIEKEFPFFEERHQEKKNRHNQGYDQYSPVGRNLRVDIGV